MLQRNASAAGLSVPVLRSKPRLGFDDVEISDDDIDDIADDVDSDAGDVEGEDDWSPRTKRAAGYRDPLVCVECALTGNKCVFSADGRGRKFTKASCDSCHRDKIACVKVTLLITLVFLPCLLTIFKAPRKTFAVLTRYSKVALVTSKPERLLKTSAPVKDDLLKRKNLPRHPELATWPCRSRTISGYEIEWSDYEDEVDNLIARPPAEVRFAKRSALANEESIEQLKALVGPLFLLL